VLREFNFYDLFILSFAQLVLATVLVLSPAREIGTGVRWPGSKITEVILEAIYAVAVAAFASFVTVELWGLPAAGVETAAILLVIFSVVVIILRPDCGVVGQVFYASYIAAGFSFIAYAAFIANAANSSIAETFTSSFLILLDLVAFLVWGSSVNYVSDVLCRTRHSRPAPDVDPTYRPMVSLHIPAYNEPPELLINTIKAAERIEYPDFEIVVIDNNTADPAIYEPVEEYCRDRERVRFVHVAPWPGYKAGACNLALRQYTSPRAEIIGLIDADDIVQPHYLRETVPYFSDPRLGFLQTFEGNRDYEGSGYYTACVDSYQAFYLAAMSSRNERDSVPFVGTMGLFRKSALENIGGWNEWCISEDTEASLRVAKAGWSGLYLPRCFGRGVVPPSYAGLNTQRHRWCFGAMQIFRLHWRSLMPWDRSPDNHLTSGQRRDYLMACLQWTRDILMGIFAFLLLVVVGLNAAGSGFALMPLAGALSLLPLSIILVATVCMTFTLHHWTTMSFRRALKSLVISLASCLVTARACVEGLARRDGVFLRTSKTGSGNHRLRKALRLSLWEALFAGALYAAAVYSLTLPRPPWLLVIIITFQATVYLCAPIAAMWNLRAQRVPAHAYRRRFEQQRLREARRGRPAIRVLGLAAVVVLALGIGAMTSAFVAPSGLLRANAIEPRTLSAQTMIDESPHMQVYLNLGSPLSRRAPYYPVTSVVLSQPLASSPTSPARLSFDTSSLALLDDIFRDDGSAKGFPSLTLAVRKPGTAGRAATTEVTETFHRAVVTSFDETMSGSPAGKVSLSLSASAYVLTSPQTLGRVGPFTSTVSTPSTVTEVYVKLGFATSKRASYVPVNSVELADPPSSPSSPRRFSLSFETSSLALLDEVLSDGRPGKQIPVLTLYVRDSSSDGRPVANDVTDTFRKARVTSLNESLSGSPTGKVTLSMQ